MRAHFQQVLNGSPLLSKSISHFPLFISLFCLFFLLLSHIIYEIRPFWIYLHPSEGERVGFKHPSSGGSYGESRWRATLANSVAEGGLHPTSGGLLSLHFLSTVGPWSSHNWTFHRWLQAEVSNKSLLRISAGPFMWQISSRACKRGLTRRGQVCFIVMSGVEARTPKPE